MIKKLDLKKVEKISKALGDPCRLSIIDSIRQNRDWLPCTQILEENKLAQSTISHHLKLLVDAELLIAEKEGRNTKYLVNKDMFNQYSKFLSGYGD